MVSVAAEGLALVALAGLVGRLLDSETLDTDDGGVLGIPAKILEMLNMEVTTTAIFVLILTLLVAKAVLRTLAIIGETHLMTGYFKRQNDDLSDAYMHADWNHVVGRRGGDMLNVMLGEVVRGTSTIRAMIGLLANSMTSLVYLFFALLVSPVAVGMFIGSFAILILIVWPIFKLIRRMANDLIPVQNQFAQRLQELFGGAKIVKSLGAEDRVHAAVQVDTSRIRWLTLRIGGLTEITATAELGVIVSLLVLMFIHVTGLVDPINAGVIGLILLRISQRVQGGFAAGGQIAQGLPSIAIVSTTLQDLRDHREETGTGKVSGPFQTMRFEDVSYEYIAGRKVLQGIEFEVQRGEFVGIIGTSGAGKTTFVDLTLGLLNPTGGKIMIGETPLSDLDRIGWRQRLGYVPQDTILFNDSVYANISAYREGVTEEDVHWAADIAQASEFIRNLEHGYDDHVGDRGVMLSGGQRQRLALARALVTHPELLILDEATSSLDSIAEREFQEALENVRGDFTILAIAHRLATVMRADRVVVVEEGRIVESGPPLELLALPDGHFRRIHQLQTGQPDT
jgi:ABC-type multidrug transport system fused ATPase/permease subunit